MLARSKKEKEPKIVFWLQSKEKESGKVTYMFQIEGTPRQVKRVARRLSGTIAGEGYNPQDKTDILIVKRNFASKKDFNHFRKQLDLALKENKN